MEPSGDPCADSLAGTGHQCHLAIHAKEPRHRTASPQPSSADSAPNPYPTPYHDRNDLATELTLTFHDASSTIPVRSVGWTTARNGGRRSESSPDVSDATGPANGATL